MPVAGRQRLAVAVHQVNRFDPGLLLDGLQRAVQAGREGGVAGAGEYCRHVILQGQHVGQGLEFFQRRFQFGRHQLQLARAAGYLCRDGAHPYTGRQLLTERQARRVNALMLTCGTYDAAGDFAYRIGLPCKSGVGGGIVAVVPDRLTLCVWSPALEPSGNSLLGMQALELFTAKTGLSIF